MSKDNNISIEEYIKSLGIELEDGVAYFTGNDFRTAIMGTVAHGGNLVYSYQRMVEHYMNENECDEESAREWIEYNTLRSIPYMGDYPPIVVYEVE